MSWLLASKVVLDLLLLATLALGMLGAAYAARALLGLPARWAAVCGFFYMAGPVVVVKLVAGHTSYLEGYAAFPFFVGLALGPRAQNRRLWLILCALALTFSTVQLQFFGLELLVLALAVVFGKRTLADAAAIFGVALPLLIPALLGPLFLSRPAHGAIAMQRAVLSWQMEQSVPPLEAFEGRGYFVRYYEQLTPFWLQHVLLLFPLCALFALIRMRREIRIAALLTTLALIAWLTATGLRGPLHGLWSAVFTHVSASSVYRELYDVVALYWLACVLLAARFWASQRAVGWLFVLFGLWATVPTWYNMPAILGWAPPAALIARLNAAAKNLPPGRILWWPSQQPIGPPNRGAGGADPLAYTPLHEDRPIFEYQPYGIFAAALTQGQQGDWNRAEPVFARLGVVAIADRLDLATFVSGKAQLARRVPRDAGTNLIADVGSVRLWRVRASRPVVSLEQNTAFMQLPRPFEHSVLNNNPGRGWFAAAYPYYWMTPAIGLCGAPSVLGYRDDFVAARKGWYFIVPVSSRGGCEWMTRAAVSRLPKGALLVAGGWSDLRPSAPSGNAPETAGSVTVQRAWSDELEGNYEASRAGVLVFRNDFDPRWNLIVDGQTLPARLVDDFANGWTVAGGAHHFILQFWPVRYLRAALIVSFAWLIYLLTQVARELRYARNGAAAH